MGEGFAAIVRSREHDGVVLAPDGVEFAVWSDRSREALGGTVIVAG